MSDDGKQRRAKSHPATPARPTIQPETDFRSADRPQRGHPLPAEGPLTEAIVAHGRTVEVSTDQKVQRGYNSDTGETITRVLTKAFGPGEVVLLPASEVERLRQLGYLVDPSRVAPPTAGSVDHTRPTAQQIAARTQRLAQQ